MNPIRATVPGGDRRAIRRMIAGSVGTILCAFGLASPTASAQNALVHLALKCSSSGWPGLKTI